MEPKLEGYDLNMAMEWQVIHVTNIDHYRRWLGTSLSESGISVFTSRESAIAHYLNQYPNTDVIHSVNLEGHFTSVRPSDFGPKTLASWVEQQIFEGHSMGIR